MVTPASLRKLVLSLEDVTEQPYFEMTSFRVGEKKVFITLNKAETRICIKLTPEDQDLFSLHDKTAIYAVPNKWGKLGWTFVDLKKVRAEVMRELVKTALQGFQPNKVKNSKTK